MGAGDFTAGVVHSFDGTAAELERVLQFPQLSIGINGCSLRTQDNLEVIAMVPLDRLLLETDSPWCEIRPSHAGTPPPPPACRACSTDAQQCHAYLTTHHCHHIQLSVPPDSPCAPPPCAPLHVQASST